MSLYHFTCDHGRVGIGDEGVLKPRTGPVGRLVWLTDLVSPMRDALGLTSHILACDRTAHRYRVTDESMAAPWMAVRGELDRVGVLALESAPGARPTHWWVAVEPVPVQYDPIIYHHGGADR